MTSASTYSSFRTSVDPNTNANATPSPMRQPLPHLADPNAQLDSQAFMEAVASLSFAADILSNAAKAISSAVESLMLASSRSNRGKVFMPTAQPFSPESRTKDWLARDYTLNPRNELTVDPTVPSLLFQSNEVIAAQQTNADEANTNDFPHVSPHTPQRDSESSADGQSDVSRLDLTEQAPVQMLATAEKSPVINEVASPLTPKVSDNDVREILCRSGSTIPEELVAETSDRSIQPGANNPNAPSHGELQTESPVITSSEEHIVDSEDEGSSNSDSEEPRSRPQRTWNLSQQHIVLDEELDVIPLICDLANYPPRKNVLCFVQDVKMFQTLERMIKELADNPVYMLIPGGPKGPKKAVGKACNSSEGCLVFCSGFTTMLPDSVRCRSFDSVIHVGWINDPDRYNEQIDASKPRRATLILTREEFDEADLSYEELSLEGYDLCLATARYNDLTNIGKLTRRREQWSDSGNYGDLCRCFEAWIEFHYSGPHERSNWSVADVAKNANTFAKKALLHGNAKVEPRNPVHRTVGRRLSVTSQFVSDFGLKDSVRSKILVVEEFDE
ncbi:hypothetical protein FRC07_003047 [Ceratobasidium sp. 392]|nr:hypothetical protein FRC07_003047 [Ceratobasidium sp. 392]